MPYRRIMLGLGLAAAIAQPTLAWTTLQGSGEAVIQHEDAGWTIELKCGSQMDDRLLFSLSSLDLAQRQDVRSVMLWIELPDGRMDRQPVDLTHSGQLAHGEWLVSDVVLDNFRNAAAIEVQINGTDTVLRTDANGTGAARLAILEQCGF